MAAPRKIASGKWIVEICVKRRRKSKTFDSKIEAKSWALETEIQLGSSDNIVRGRTIADLCDRYAKEIVPLHKGHRWELIKLNSFKNDYIADDAISEMSCDDVNAWIVSRSKTVSNASICRELNLLSSMFTYAIKCKWCRDNPVSKADKPKQPPPRDRRISNEEIELITSALDYQKKPAAIDMRFELATAFLLAIETAMRQGEIWGLYDSDIYLNDRFVRLNDTKNGTSRDVPLTKKAIALIESLNLKKGKLFKSSQASAGQLFTRTIKILGIINLTFHDTRHEALTRLARKLDVLDLARMVGHRDPRSLMIYYNPTASEIAKRLD